MLSDIIRHVMFKPPIYLWCMSLGLIVCATGQGIIFGIPMMILTESFFKSFAEK